MCFGRESLSKWIRHTKHTTNHDDGVVVQNCDLERIGSIYLGGAQIK